MVQAFLCLIQHHMMKYEEVDMILHLFLTSALDTGELLSFIPHLF